MIGVAEAFSPGYAEARRKFLQGCVAAGLKVDTHPHPLKGRDGEALAMDVALDGPADAKHLLIVTSACHGIEGHCGSGVQVFALHDAEWRDKARAAGVAVLYVHALNPHGFSHGRRVTQENVDLNRNFVDYTQPLPVNEAYAGLHALLLPTEWPPSPNNQAQIAAWIDTHGVAAYQAAISGGQYQFDDGLFFGGKAPTWSNRTFRQVLRAHGQAAQRLAWIDLHTGLGPNGIGERIFACRDDRAAYARANAWWGTPEAPVTSIYDGSSTSALLTGLMCTAMYEECPQAEYTAIALEYGTQPILEVMGALRADHWLHAHPEAAPELADAIHAQMLEAFYTDTDAWKGQVISQARQAMFQAVDGLAARS
ncbi:M14 family metallopeptidase [Variovorax sp. J22G21]|uniref:M14 family metallopeptidase n=1 Tax=Variovorax fucosicus TaxID=3053517 RepID=UPI0025755BE1|nr:MULTISPECIES: M14 family metallopeptidase [unclassified Variovorax]MDM0038542.1 M14 family metallopeptidase [Variovorax sp. J22R193]MDM0063318.1 M14 family metallopeptidase [Variovorax sp. J22G21]